MTPQKRKMNYIYSPKRYRSILSHQNTIGIKQSSIESSIYEIEGELNRDIEEEVNIQIRKAAKRKSVNKKKRDLNGEN